MIGKRAHSKPLNERELLLFEMDCAEKVLADAVDRYRKIDLDLLQAWNSVEQAMSKVRFCREAVVENNNRAALKTAQRDEP